MKYPDFSSGKKSIWPATLKEAGLILVLTLVLTGVWWLARTPHLPLLADPTVYELELDAPLVEVPQARELFDEGAHLFIDTRPGNPLERPTIAGAFIIREASFDDDLLALFDILFPEDPLIVFGRGDMQGANNIASKLQARGFTDVQILRGGVKSWEQAGGQLGSAYIPDGFPLDDGSLPSGDGGGS
jgi:rhodanese-related sulfurtransferase